MVAPPWARHFETKETGFLRNIKAADGGHIADLTACAAYAGGAPPGQALDVRNLQPVFDGPWIARMVADRLSDWEAVDLRMLRVLLGANRAAKVVHEALTSGMGPACADSSIRALIAQAGADRARELSARGEFPFALGRR